MKYLLLIGLLFFACKKDAKYCYVCHQGFNAGGQPPRDFDTCFNSESDYTNHRWRDANGNDLTVNCDKR